MSTGSKHDFHCSMYLKGTLVCKRRKDLRSLWPVVHVQNPNLQCSPFHFRPLFIFKKRKDNKNSSCIISLIVTTVFPPFVFTWIELLNQWWHCISDGVSSNEQVISQISPWTFGGWNNKKKQKKTKTVLKCDPVKFPITSTQAAVVPLCYPERRPPERPRPRPWVSPEVCESGSCWQNPSGLVWELAGWWCGWVKSAASRDPESKGRTHFCIRRKSERLPCSIM